MWEGWGTPHLLGLCHQERVFQTVLGVQQVRSQKQPPGPPGLPRIRLRWEFQPFGLPLQTRPQRVLGRPDAARGRRSLELGTSPGLPHGSPVTLSPSPKPEPRFPTCVNKLLPQFLGAAGASRTDGLGTPRPALGRLRTRSRVLPRPGHRGGSPHAAGPVRRPPPPSQLSPVWC